MKKFLLLFASAVMAFGASAQTLTQDWKHDVSLVANDARQGVGINGKIYINNKAEQKVYVYSSTGLEATTLPGGQNAGINRDAAGNIVVSTVGWAASWKVSTDVFKVYNPATPETVTTLTLTDDTSLLPGKCYFIGKAIGDLTSTGEICVVGDATGDNAMIRFVISDGAITADSQNVSITDGKLTASTTNVINPFMEGTVQKYLYVYRSGSPAIFSKDADAFKVEKTLSLPNKDNSNGAEIFILGGKKFVVYPYKGSVSYLDGFAIAEVGATEVTVKYDAEKTSAPNTTQTNWLNAEVIDDYTAIIYQYVPGAYCAQYTFKLPEEPSGINDVTVKCEVEVKKVIENGQIYIIKGDAKYNLMGVQVN
ncbi:MAG: hypothetical protein ACI31C_01135 [Muribaculaceae bacterium]